MKTEIQEAFQDLLSTNLRTDGRRDYYGIKVLEANGLTGLILITWTFKEGTAYCCEEPGCHFSESRGIPALRAAMTKRGILDFPPIKIHAQCVVESGANFGKYDNEGSPFRGCGYDSEGQTYTYTWNEKC